MKKTIQKSSYNVIHRDFKQTKREQKNVQSNQAVTTVVWRQQPILAIVLVVIAVTISLTLLMQIFNNFQKVSKLDQQILAVQGEQQAAQVKQDELSVQVQLLQNDEYIAKLARSEYYLSKKGEIIFSLPEDYTDKPTNTVNE